MNRPCILFLLLGLIVGSCKSKPDLTPIASIESVHLSLGNPTGAKTDTSTSDNYLMVKKEYVLSYNRSKRHPNWVSWELTTDYMGGTERQSNFFPDTELPAGWYRVVPADYTNSGFDRGHMIPSADRTSSEESNASTFLMTNIIPQAPELNRESWAQLEEFSRDLARRRYRLFIIAGAYGTSGEGGRGAATTIRNNINVPSRNYKIIVAVPDMGGVDDIKESTPVIAVDMPNVSAQVNDQKWTSFITTPAEIEGKASVAFFTTVPEAIRAKLRQVRYNPASSPARELIE